MQELRRQGLAEEGRQGREMPALRWHRGALKRRRSTALRCAGLMRRLLRAGPADLAEILAERKPLEVLDHDVFQPRQQFRIGSFDPHGQRVRRCLQRGRAIIRERDAAFLRGEFHRELVAPVLAELLQIAAGGGGGDLGLGDEHAAIPVMMKPSW